MCAPENSSAEVVQASRRRRRWPRLLLLVGVLTVVAAGSYLAGGGRAGRWLVEREQRLERLCDEHMLAVCAVAVVLYVVVTAFSIPVATVLSLAMGRLLGFWPAVLVVSFGSTLGATAAMLLGRTLFRESVVNRLGPRGETLLKAFEHNGAFFLFTLRMMPQVPFVLVNLVMSVSTIRARTFFWVSQLGMLPATCLYVFTGSQLPSLVAITQAEVGVILTWPLILGLVMLGCFPLLVKLCWPKGTAQWDESGASEGESEGEAGS